MCFFFLPSFFFSPSPAGTTTPPSFPLNRPSIPQCPLPFPVLFPVHRAAYQVRFSIFFSLLHSIFSSSFFARPLDPETHSCDEKRSPLRKASRAFYETPRNTCARIRFVRWCRKKKKKKKFYSSLHRAPAPTKERPAGRKKKSAFFFSSCYPQLESFFDAAAAALHRAVSISSSSSNRSPRHKKACGHLESRNRQTFGRPIKRLVATQTWFPFRARYALTNLHACLCALSSPLVVWHSLVWRCAALLPSPPCRFDNMRCAALAL